MTTAERHVMQKKDYKSDQEVRWCPGCGDYAILNAVHGAFAKLQKQLHETVVISGIGCSSRFPYYMETYGFHTIHGRAPTIATGVKLANPALDVWVVTGDGDAMSIGGNHFIHMLRRNVGLKVLMFNNRIYGLTKGQYSPTSEQGKITKSSPLGTIDYPFKPMALALGAGATFLARGIDVFLPHLEDVICKASAHTGTAFCEIYQNCNIFNDLAFEYATSKETKDDTTVVLEHGKPLVFGKDRKKGIRLNGMDPEVVELGGDIKEDDLLFHDERQAEPSLAYLLSRMHYPEFPEPMGIFRCVERPTYEDMLTRQVADSVKAKGTGQLESLYDDGETWLVE